MLSFEEKIEIFRIYLEKEEGNYGDQMKNEIFFSFFENEWDLKFLNDLNSKEGIENKIELVVGKMILKENQDGLENIMAYQFYG